MVRYLSKFVLEVMPSVIATVIGAYIVAHYINPRTEAPKAAVASSETTGAQAADAADATEVKISADAKADDVKMADTKAVDAKPVDAKPVDAKPADARPAASDQARPVRQIAITKPAPPAEAKKDANELARAAIERLRGSVDTAATASVAPQPARAPVETVPAQPPQEAASQEQPARPEPMSREPVRIAAPLPVIRAPVTTIGSTVVAPPLPPPVIVATPYGRHSVGPGPAMPVTQTDPTANSAIANPPIPPADIPMPHSFELPPPAAPVENVADHMLSTTKAFFRALTPH